MKYWMIVCCLFVLGCGKSGPSNVMDNSNQKALAEYEAALAEADALAAGDTDFEEQGKKKSK